MVSRRGWLKRRIIIKWSVIHPPSTIFFVHTILSSFLLLLSSAGDTITLNYLLKDGETLVSAGERFELGFFSLKNSSADIRRYVGIWYHKSVPRIYVWVANRDKPLPDCNGVLAIADDGNLKLFDENRNAYWYTDAASSSSPNRVAKLMDSGNLLLSDEQSTNLWESFNHPTDTFLAGMKMDENLQLTSWASQDDPKAGNFIFKMAPGLSTYQIFKSYIPYWKSEFSGNIFSSNEKMPYPIAYFLSNFSPSVKPKKNSFYIISNISTRNYNSTRLIMNLTGEIQYWSKYEVNGWSLDWLKPKDNCSVFHRCGNFGSCNSNNRPECKCLPGFEPKSPESWNSGDFTSGCTKTPLCAENDRFLSLKMMRVGNNPASEMPTTNETECVITCRNSCHCQAYSYEESKSEKRGNPATCFLWTEDLYDLQEEYANVGHDLHVRSAASNIESSNNMPHGGGQTKQTEAFKGRKEQWNLIVGVTIACVVVVSCGIIFFYIRRKKAKSQEDRTIIRPNMAVRFYDSERHVKDMVDSSQFKEEDKKGIDLPFIDFESILAATDNFSEANKLGKGGFGPVYKGKLPGGQEVAIKRLSSFSGQGLEEFRNEVVLIARLQHRNLVRLLGYCIEGGEKLLLYEYMPNKSLDTFLFDRTLGVFLDWEMRFNIILGIARGLLYLHQDSRLRIIHRDLKTSNILLDQEMNPKISDFGLARIFEGKQTEGTTNRVVGTYGYMSPEYALDGFFSVKSDVFSFGVVVLEIISGTRNTGFYNSEEALSLLGYAWKLWQEDKALDIVDQKLSESSKINEILKCINVALLCLQEDPNDRPTMSNVVIMLGSESTTLPTPRRPAFVLTRGPSSTAASSSKMETNTYLTVSTEGR